LSGSESKVESLLRLADLWIEKVKVLRIVYSPVFEELFNNKKDLLKNLWKVKFDKFIEMKEDIMDNFKENITEDDAARLNEELDGILKLNYILNAVQIYRSREDALTSFTSLENVEIFINEMPSITHLHFFMVYLITDLSSFSKEDVTNYLELLSPLTTLSEGSLDYFCGLCKLDNALCPLDPDLDEKEAQYRLSCSVKKAASLFVCGEENIRDPWLLKAVLIGLWGMGFWNEMIMVAEAFGVGNDSIGQLIIELMIRNGQSKDASAYVTSILSRPELKDKDKTSLQESFIRSLIDAGYVNEIFDSPIPVELGQTLEKLLENGNYPVARILYLLHCAKLREAKELYDGFKAQSGISIPAIDIILAGRNNAMPDEYKFDRIAGQGNVHFTHPRGGYPDSEFCNLPLPPN